MKTRTGAIAGYGPPCRRPYSIGDQQAEMALQACRRTEAKIDEAGSETPSEPLCPYCGAEMTLSEGRQLGAILHVSAGCPRCGCLRATYFEPGIRPRWFPDLVREASPG